MAKSATQDSNPFGRKITQVDAQRMYKSFFKIKKRSLDKFKGPFTDDCESMRYHGGLYKQQSGSTQGSQFNCSFLDMAYVFDRETLNDMLNPPDGKPVPNGIILFHGAREKEDSLLDELTKDGDNVLDKDGNKVQQFIDVDGRPTLLVFPFQYTGAEPEWTTQPSANIAISLDDGLEHPGTGGGGGSGVGTPVTASSVGPQPAETPLPIPGTLPGTFAVVNIHHIFFEDK
jgi:hypothetical protein